MTPDKSAHHSSPPCLALRRSELVCEVSQDRFRNLEKAFIFCRVVEENESGYRARVLLPLRVLVRWQT